MSDYYIIGYRVILIRAKVTISVVKVVGTLLALLSHTVACHSEFYLSVSIT